MLEQIAVAVVKGDQHRVVGQLRLSFQGGQKELQIDHAQALLKELNDQKKAGHNKYQD